MAEKKIKLSELTILDLMGYEQATKLEMEKYNNKVQRYDGSTKPYGDEYERLVQIGRIHDLIHTEIERRLNLIVA